MGAQCALGRGHTPLDEIEVVLLGLVDRVTRRMRAARRVGRTITLRLRFDDFARVTRSHTLVTATAATPTILGTAVALLRAAHPLITARGCTLVGVAVGNLSNTGAEQLVLPFERQTATALDAAVDGVRDRFGTAALSRGALLGRDIGLSVPLLPD
jgi:DNA polymerase-4